MMEPHKEYIMAIRDLGLPVGSVIALTGSAVIPHNFRALDGSVVASGGKSSLDGTRLPDWNRTEVLPVGGNSSGGAVISRRTQASKVLDWGNFNSMSIDTPVTRFLTGINGDIAMSPNDTQDLSDANYFVQPVPYSNGFWNFRDNGSFSGGDYQMVNSHYSNATKSQTMTHTHMANLKHNEYHDFVLKDTSKSNAIETTTDVAFYVEGNSSVSTTNLPLTYNLKTNVGLWVMRIY
ncbi:hypothetical protein S140_121 [Shewanella sp. phage 1/40]|uniref:hypothetical protein n=1 Tax=Shewanella sp. phage 1/40 TaxID=1458860 RepID=UPI0004F7E0C3|nr:hypothetical protein S140_121 [Shewanella sp. phage 1/40]AHK11528.1 hypothetical protein S140_121 [Shewanella sp. phage 1/40]